MPKENVTLFEIFGPVMIGPSSSHTAGVVRIAYLVRKMFGRKPGKATVRFYGSLAATWKGHGSGKAAVAGLMGIPPGDDRMTDEEKMIRDARESGEYFPVELISMPDLPAAWHPNSVVFDLEAELNEPVSGESGNAHARTLQVRASSVGGGAIRIDEIDGYPVALSGQLNALLVLHHDEVGVIAIVSHILAASRINIADTSSRRKEKGDEALLVVETDGPIPDTVVGRIEGLSPIYRVVRVPALEQL